MPLLNNKKEVIGVNYQGIAAMSVSNIFFAVPINLALIVVQDAISKNGILYRIPGLVLLSKHNQVDAPAAAIGF